jgi:glucose dehydrogenase
MEAKGLKNLGAINLGGSIATGGGVLFIAATADAKFRAFESRTGKELWLRKLDSVGNATPITYRGRNGKQYVVIVAGGPGHLRESPIPPSDIVTAFALP